MEVHVEGWHLDHKQEGVSLITSFDQEPLLIEIDIYSTKQTVNLSGNSMVKNCLLSAAELEF